MKNARGGEKRKQESRRDSRWEAQKKRGSYHNVLLLIGILLMGSGVQAGWQPESERTVNRINYGVVFENVGSVLPTTSIARHTFKLILPLQKDAQDFEIMRSMDLMNSNRLPCMGEEAGIGEREHNALCHKFKRNLNFLSQINRDGSEQLKLLVEDIYALLPDSTKNKGKQEKRAVFGFIGDLLNNVIGTAKQEDIDVLNSNVLKLTESYNHDLGILKKTVTDVADYAEKTTLRLDSLVEEMKVTAARNLKIMATIVQNEDKILEFMNNVTLSIFQLNQWIETLSLHYSNYLSGVQTLTGGHLPMYLIPKNVLEKVLREIQDDLKDSDTGKNFAVIHLKSDYYYKKATYVFARDENYLCYIASTLNKFSVKIFDLQGDLS